MLLYLGIACCGIGIQLLVTIDIETVDMDGKLIDIADGIDAQQPHFIRESHVVADIDGELGTCELVLLIAQIVHAGPFTPLGEGNVDVVVFLFSGDVIGLLHAVVPLNGHFSTFAEITIEPDEGVEGLYVFRLFKSGDVFLPVVLERPESGDAGGRAVVVGRIVLIE